MTRYAVALVMPTTQVLAGGQDDAGQLNPPEIGISRVLDNAARGAADMMACASG